MEPKPQSDASPEERRLATVLFADVQGFTALDEQLDSEAMGDLIKDIWSRLDAIIEDGADYMHMGDSILAFWGAPSAGERDAKNVVEPGSIRLHAQGTFESTGQAGQ